MRRGVRTTLLALALGALVATLVGANASATASPPAAPAAPVPSLEPAKTRALWQRLVEHPRHERLKGECRPLRGVFYAATDWLRLATKLAVNASPCGSYYVSIPPVVSDKTKLRPDQARQIRALGANFHALAEFHWSAWSKWVASTGSTWYMAGVEARKRMAEAGFDVAAGDTWAVNEFPSTVRSGVGPARANARELVRGLFQGDGTRTARGVVFIVGIGQSTGNVSVYQANLQNWLADVGFWSDMSAYVSDWSQEVYPDYRRYAVPGADVTVRRDYLNDFLQHTLVVSRAGPSTIEPGRSYLAQALSPVAGAAWQYDSGYGWTNVPYDQMQAFVSGQVYALRSASVAAGAAQDHWGFAWQPKNASGLSAGDFASQTGAILDRLGAAIRDSGQGGDADPGSGACGPPGENRYCVGDLSGASFAEQWKAFRAWSQPVLTFSTQPQSLVAGTPSAQTSLALVTSAGAPQVATAPVAIALTSSSEQGAYSLGPGGPWTATITVTIPAGANASPPFFYRDTRAGQPQLRATTPAATTVTQVQTVVAGPPASLHIAPARATLSPHRSHGFSVSGADAFGNPVTEDATWNVTPSRLATVKPATGIATRITTGGRGGIGRLIATAQGATGVVVASAPLQVSPGSMRVPSLRYGATKRTVRVTLTVSEVGGPPVQGAQASVVVRRDGHFAFAGRKRTDRYGRATFLVPRGSGCYSTEVAKVTSPGYRWNGKTPDNRFCA
jgi:hypothetical protein